MALGWLPRALSSCSFSLIDGYSFFLGRFFLLISIFVTHFLIAFVLQSSASLFSVLISLQLPLSLDALMFTIIPPIQPSPSPLVLEAPILEAPLFAHILSYLFPSFTDTLFSFAKIVSGSEHGIESFTSIHFPLHLYHDFVES